MFFLYKEAVYGHGIFWIGDNFEEGKRKADEAANADVDFYHAWFLCTFVDNSDNYQTDAEHIKVYKGVRKESIKQEKKFIEKKLKVYEKCQRAFLLEKK